MTADLMNALVAQNNQICVAIEYSEDADGLEQASKLIDFVADVWSAVDYGYKLVEVRERLKRKANELASAERAYIDGCRKNCRTLGSAKRNLSRLESLC